MERLVTLAKIIELLGPIKGEKSLQKIIYLIDSYGIKLRYHYSWQQFGPISYQLQKEIQELQALGFITIEYENKIPIYRGQQTYDHLTPFWKDKYNSFSSDRKLKRVINFLSNLGDKRENPDFLEMIASLDYIERHEHTTEDGLRINPELYQTARKTLTDLQTFQY